MSWSMKFREPITLSDGSKLETLKDAAEYCAAVPARHEMAPEWQLAAEMLMKAADKDGLWVDMARVAMVKALVGAATKKRGRPPKAKRETLRRYSALPLLRSLNVVEEVLEGL
jgi:hypothetical protein